MLPVTATASEYRLLDTEELHFEYSQLDHHNRDPIAPQYTGRWRDRAALSWDATWLGYKQYKLLWNHYVHTETIDTGGVKTVGWEWWAGISLGQLDILHHHHSRHIMDEPIRDDRYGNKQNKFPVEDSMVIRFKFITRGK
jgi:hypothetical protein